MSAALFEDYRDRIQRPEIRTASDVARRSVVKSVPVFAFQDGGTTVRLTRPLALRVGLDEGLWFVENEALSLFGHGATVEEAVDEFLHDLAYLWNRYRSLSFDEVSGKGKELKQLLSSLTE